MRRIIRLAVILAAIAVSLPGNAADIRFRPDLKIPTGGTMAPAVSDGRWWGLSHVVDERLLITSDMGAEASLWLPHTPAGRIFRASYIAITHTGQGDPVFIRYFTAHGDTASWRTVSAEPDSIQTWYFPGQVDSLRLWKEVNTGDTYVHIQAW